MPKRETDADSRDKDNTMGRNSKDNTMGRNNTARHTFLLSATDKFHDFQS